MWDKGRGSACRLQVVLLVILLVSCWSLEVLKVCPLELRLIKVTCALYDLCSVWLAPSSVNSKGQQKYDLCFSVQKLWGS